MIGFSSGRPKVTLRVIVAGRPLDTLDAVTLRLDDGPKEEVSLDGVTGQDLAVPLTLSRGDPQGSHYGPNLGRSGSGTLRGAARRATSRRPRAWWPKASSAART